MLENGRPSVGLAAKTSEALFVQGKRSTGSDIRDRSAVVPTD